MLFLKYMSGRLLSIPRREAGEHKGHDGARMTQGEHLRSRARNLGRAIQKE